MKLKKIIFLLIVGMCLITIGGVSGSTEDSNINSTNNTFFEDATVNETPTQENLTISCHNGNTSIGINDPYTTNPVKYNDHTVLGTKEQTLNSYNKNGALMWKTNLDSWAITNPGIGEDGPIYVGLANGEIVAVNPDGSLKWNQQTDSHINSLEKTDNGISVKTDNGKNVNINEDGNASENNEEPNLEMKIPSTISYNVLLSKTYYHNLKRRIVEYDEENGEVNIEYELD